MLTLVSCPTCHHKFTIPEGAMGKRHTCPNCQSLFVAGKSVAEAEGKKNAPSMLSAAAGPSMLSAGGRAPIDKTMLGETDAPLIKYNCPRCKKPLEAPASEAGTKKPCPSCGGRLQVPAAPPRPAAAFDPMQKTMLAGTDESGLQATAPAPAMPAASAPAAPPVSAPAYAAPMTAPPAAGKWKIYALGGVAAALVAVIVLLLIGRNAAAEEEKRFFAARQAELDKLKAEIEQKTALMQKQQELEEQNRKNWQAMVERYEARQKKLDEEREAERRAAASDDAKKEADRKAADRKRQLEDEQKALADARAKAEADLKNQINDLRRQVDNANQKTTTVIQAAPPIHPWYGYYGRPYPWW